MSTAAFSLTRRQRETFDIIAGHIAANGQAPSYDEIARALGLRSKSTVATLVDGLVQRGLIKRLGRTQRSLTLVTTPAAGLPAHLHARLARYCAPRGEDFEAVLADAVALHLDAVEKAPAFEVVEGGQQ